MRSLSDLNGVKVLSKKEQKLIVGALICERTNSKGESKTFEPIGAASAVAWVDAWNALGWTASCKG